MIGKPPIPAKRGRAWPPSPRVGLGTLRSWVRFAHKDRGRITAIYSLTTPDTGNNMATSKTGSFWLTETVVMPVTAVSGDRFGGTLDLGAYVDVGDGQAIAIEQVDFIMQIGTDFGGPLSQACTADSSFTSQLSDLNPSDQLIRADDNALIASAAIDIDFSNNQGTTTQDFYPDNFGKLEESRMVVNDSLFVVCGVDGGDVATSIVNITARIKCRIVKLSTKDWMAIAIQSTASDN